MSPDYNRGRGKAVYDSDRNRYKSRSDERYDLIYCLNLSGMLIGV